MDPLYNKERDDRIKMWADLQEYDQYRRLLQGQRASTSSSFRQPLSIYHVEESVEGSPHEPLHFCDPKASSGRELPSLSVFPHDRSKGPITYQQALAYVDSFEPEPKKLCVFCRAELEEHWWTSFNDDDRFGTTSRWLPPFCTLYKLLDRLARDFFPERRVYLDFKKSLWSSSGWSDYPSLIFHEVDEIYIVKSTTWINMQQKNPQEAGLPSVESVFLSSGQTPAFTKFTASMTVQQQLAMLETWVNSCDKREPTEDDDDVHDTCHKDMSTIIPAKRVLDLSNVASGTVRVVDSENLTGRYIALSHCWGKDRTRHPLMTTRATLEKHMASIAFTDLPQSFRDAICVCIYLGINYLWIDCLCIIQGDSDDFLSEAEKMADIYSKSYLTIAASRALNSQHGFLYDFSADTMSYTVKAEAPWSRDDPEKLFRASFQINHKQSKTDSTPLNNRAWCLQEWYLPKRLVEFCLNDIRFICLRNVKTRFGNTNDSDTRTRTLVRGFGFADESFFRTQWENIWDDFSGRRITKISDRLPAMAGLARMLENSVIGVRGHKYLAGLWSKRLSEDLSWTAVEYEDDCKVLTKVPSWSWASIETPGVYIYGKPSATFVELVKSQCTGYAQPKETLPFLKVRGFVQSLYLRIDDRRDGYDGRQHSSFWKKPYTAMTTSTDAILEDEKVNRLPGMFVSDMRVRPSKHTHHTVATGTTLHYVPSILRASSEDEECSICTERGYLSTVKMLLLTRTDSSLTALVLSPIPSRDDGRVQEGEEVYQRLGLLEMNAIRQNPTVGTSDGMKMSWDAFWNVKKPLTKREITLV